MYKKFCVRPEVSYTRVIDQELERLDQTNELEINEVFKVEQTQPKDFHTLVTSLAILSIILAYFYLCDR